MITQSAVVDQWRPIAGDTHFVHALCGANDYGLAAAQEDFEAIFFDWGMESADEDHAGIAKVPYEVVGLEDQIGTRIIFSFSKSAFSKIIGIAFFTNTY